MKISILKEVKIKEGRVAVIPENVRTLVQNGHKVYVQKDAGINSGFPDVLYKEAGATILLTTKELIDQSDLVLKVKEPTIDEVKMMREGQMFFGFLHLAPIPDTLHIILKKKIIALGYETLQLNNKSLPLLIPMSEIAGKLATQNGAHLLRFDQGGMGILMGGTTTVPPAKTLVIGAGTVGQNAADVAIGMGSETTLLDISQKLLDDLKQKKYQNRCTVAKCTPEILEKLVPQTDLLIGAVLICGEKAPHLVSEALVKKMKKGSVIIDVSVDQGGCVETSEVTSHEHPFVLKHGVLHYGVPNMPGSVPHTSTLALNHAAFPYIKALADLGLNQACEQFPELTLAINCSLGKIVHHSLK